MKAHPLVLELRALRRARKWSQERVAEWTGFYPRTVASWEQGARVPRLDDFEIYAAALDQRLELTKRGPACVE